MKRLSNLKLSSIIFGILMCLPMFSILARVIYVQSNPNAKDSYYGETINEIQYINLGSQDNIKFNNVKYSLQTELQSNDYLFSTGVVLSVQNMVSNQSCISVWYTTLIRYHILN